MNFKKWVKSIQNAGYNGASTVYDKSLLSKLSEPTFFAEVKSNLDSNAPMNLEL